MNNEEKLLLERINRLYKQVKGEFINSEVLYNGKFLSLISELYKLPNDKIVKKEKIIKNSGKNSVIVIAITEDNKYIITFQSRMKNQLLAEFPAGYIEENEDVIEAAKRELIEETGYATDNLTIIDEVFSAPSIDYAKTYIVVANDCTKTAEVQNVGTELVNYGLFTEAELQYLVDNNIMNGAMNKLAYYKLINNNSKKYIKRKN